MKNRRGFTLVELLVSFILITIVSISLFKTVLSVQKKAQRDISYNQYISFAATFNNAIENDFNEDTITEFTSCGVNCYDITYTTAGTKRIIMDKTNKTISYGTIKEKLPNNYVFYNDIIITSERANGTPDNTYNTIITLRIPIKSNLVDYNQDIKYIYQYYDETSGGVLESIYCNLTVDPNGGTYSGSTGSTNYQLLPNDGQNIADPTGNNGYVFTGWTLTGGGSISNGIFTASSTVEDSVLTANWTAYSDMYTYTGSSAVINDGSGNWRIKFLTGGILTPLMDIRIDSFLVGGGGAGGRSSDNGTKCGGGGGGAGYASTHSNILLTANTQYEIVIGAGGIHSTANSGYGGTGGATTAFGYTSNGGTGGYGSIGTTGPNAGGTGGSNGGQGITGTGYAGYSYGSTGQGTTTCEFGEGTTTSCTLGTLYAYAGGGGGGGGNGGAGGAGGIRGGGAGRTGNASGENGTTNTGGGGGGSGAYGTNYGGDGGSGIVVIRNHR